MASPTDRRYLESHEWHKLDGDVVTIGISQFAVEELTDITYVDIVKTEGDISCGESFGEIESVKATSDLYTAVGGIVVEINEKAVDDPTIINSDPFGEGWLIKIQISDATELDALLDSVAYDEQAT